jgi:catechol 2,3-dioxygenase-like lactoylglutathione lyase family enzyme
MAMNGIKGGGMSLAQDATAAAAEAKSHPALKLNFLSHGTLESRDLAFSRRFYEEFLGLEVVQTSPISLLIRLGGPNTIAVVYSKQARPMNLLNHNGLDVRTKEEVDAAYRTVVEQAESWRLKKIGKPRLQHGTYSFFFWDADENCWEILTNPEGGYSWLFEQGDQKGKGHLDRIFKRPGVSP